MTWSKIKELSRNFRTHRCFEPKSFLILEHEHVLLFSCSGAGSSRVGSLCKKALFQQDRLTGAQPFARGLEFLVQRGGRSITAALRVCFACPTEIIRKLVRRFLDPWRRMPAALIRFPRFGTRSQVCMYVFVSILLVYMGESNKTVVDREDAPTMELVRNQSTLLPIRWAGAVSLCAVYTRVSGKQKYALHIPCKLLGDFGVFYLPGHLPFRLSSIPSGSMTCMQFINST